MCDRVIYMFGKVCNLKAALGLFLMSLMLVGSLGVSHMAMSMDMDGHMTDCPFMPGVSICTMTPVEMVVASQSFLSNITLQQDFALLLALGSALLILAVFPRFFSPPKVLIRFWLLKHRYRLFYSFLDEAFSSGILNPKLY